LLIYDPAISRLLAVSRLYVPLSSEKKDELLHVVSRTETYDELPEWVKSYLAEVDTALKEDIQKYKK
jgi:hypothetical protein